MPNTATDLDSFHLLENTSVDTLSGYFDHHGFSVEIAEGYFWATATEMASPNLKPNCQERKSRGFPVMLRRNPSAEMAVFDNA